MISNQHNPITAIYYIKPAIFQSSSITIINRSICQFFCTDTLQIPIFTKKIIKNPRNKLDANSAETIKPIMRNRKLSSEIARNEKDSKTARPP